VNQLDQVTQQNAALVEQSAAAAESLNQQAARLVEAVSVFTLIQGETRTAIAQAQATSKVRSRVLPSPEAAMPAARKSPPPAAKPHDKGPTAADNDGWETF
jgi:hypothetical protein